MKVFVTAPAKINLALRVGAPRPDGFHPLDTVFTALDLVDDVVATSADGLSMSIEGRGADLPVDDSNLVMKAARALQARVGKPQLGAHIHVVKRIPVAGGMAGGSADCAGALVALNELWQLGLSDEDLLDVGAELGSDVPFALFGGVAHGTGRGEKLTAVPANGQQSWIVLVNSEGLSTPAVFRRFDELVDAGEPASTEDLRVAVATGDNRRIAELMTNDLQPVATAMRPDLAALFADLSNRRDIAKVMLSGSGPSVVLLVDDDRAAAIASEIAQAYPQLEVVRAKGPARGAQLVQVTDVEVAQEPNTEVVE